MIARIVLSVLPLVLFFVSLFLIVRAVIGSSSPVLGLGILGCVLIYVSSGAWKRFSVSRVVRGES